MARSELVLWALGLLVASSFAGGSATAQPNADALTRAGRASFEQATETGHWKAIRSFEAALATDPKHAPAEAGLSDAYVLLYLHVRPNPEYLAKAKNHAARAVALAPASSQAHAARAQILNLERDLAGAKREYELALEADPANTAARQAYAGTLMSLGQVQQSLAQVSRAAAEDPGSALRQGMASRLHQVARRYDEAIRYGARAQQLNPNLPAFFRMSLAYSYWAKQRNPEAAEALLLDPGIPGNQKPALRGLVQAQGLKALVKQLHEAQVARSGKPCTDIPAIAGTVLAFLDESAKAVECLTLSMRGVPPSFLELDPILDPIRKDPGFARLVAQRPGR
jgi:tetratricopeptide (TPR) repeat protein